MNDELEQLMAEYTKELAKKAAIAKRKTIIEAEERANRTHLSSIKGRLWDYERNLSEEITRKQWTSSGITPSPMQNVTATKVLRHVPVRFDSDGSTHELTIIINKQPL